jgi:hypothetical protein
LERLRVEHANAVAHAERLASTIASVEQTLQTLGDASTQQQIPLAPAGFRQEHRVSAPTATAIGSSAAPASNGWARRLQGLSQHEAVIQIAEDNDGIVRTGEAANILIKAGLSTAGYRNLYRYLLSFLSTSGKFKKVGKGTYQLVTSDAWTDYQHVPRDESDDPRAQ